MWLSNVTSPLTCDDLWRIREASDERLEIIDGELFATPSSTLTHQAISGRLIMAFDQVVDQPRIGVSYFAMLDVRLATDTVVLPDLMIVLKDRYHLLTEWGIDGPPTLLAEIVSSFGGVRTATRDHGLKRDVYARYGVSEYWLVDPESGTLTVFSEPHGGCYHREVVNEEIAISATIPGLSVDLAPLFASPLERE
jgi:Uma2 family endonuclease